MSGAIDLWGSRRANFERCEWFQRDEKATKDQSRLVFKDKPTCVFYAKESNAFNYQKEQLGGVFMADESVVTLETTDNVNGIKTGDRIKYRGTMWAVTSVQASEKHKQSQFLDQVTKTTYIGLKQ